MLPMYHCDLKLYHKHPKDVVAYERVNTNVRVYKGALSMRTRQQRYRCTRANTRPCEEIIQVNASGGHGHVSSPTGS